MILKLVMGCRGIRSILDGGEAGRVGSEAGKKLLGRKERSFILFRSKTDEAGSTPDVRQTRQPRK